MEPTSQFEHGVLSLEGDVLRYQGSREPSWSLPVSQLAVVGEYTNQSDPWGDDWFLVFVCQESSEFFLAPAWAEGVHVIREHLGEMLGAAIPASLANSADFKSIVLWPPSLAGSALMTFEEPASPGLLARVRNAILPSANVLLSPAVVAQASRVGT